jgi:pyridoxamine 5'-phosphate oxidase
VPSRAWLEERVAALDREHAGGELPAPEHWGGYRLAPDAWEFWQHRPNRLHDRFRYEREPSGAWTIERLGP